jgi:hypothetical protein
LEPTARDLCFNLKHIPLHKNLQGNWAFKALCLKKKYIYKTSSSKDVKPRTTQAAQKAGQHPPLEPVKRAFSASGSVTVAQRQKKIEEVERQILEGANKFKEEKMVKTMISPAARDAPKFSSNRPQELRRFLRLMEDLWKEAGITDDEEKKASLGKYADHESEEEWKAFENYPRGNSWDQFKEELITNYPEAAESERGTPARIKQVCRDSKGIKLGDLGALYAFRRAFMAEAKKLTQAPAAMANRELVEMFIGTLSPAFGTAVIQFLGNKIEAAQTTAVTTGVSRTPRRPEDKYDLEEVCKAAIQVSENSQGMFHLMKSGIERSEGRKESNFNQGPLETNNLVQKLEGLENNQAVEKDKLEVTNKNLNNRFNDLEKMMKSLMNQVQNGSGNRREPVEQYNPNSGIKLGQPGTIPKWGPPASGRNSNMENGCFYCGGKDHFIPECDELKEDIRTGYVRLNNEGKIRNGDGGFIPRSTNGSIKERIEKQKMLKQNQFYCGYDESDYIAEPVVPMYPAQFINTTENSVKHHSRLERELKLQEKEEELELRKLKLEKEEMRREQNRSSNSTQLLEKVLEQISTKEDAAKVGFC